MKNCCTLEHEGLTLSKNMIALIGNPNSGKSLLFNRLTGLNQKVANFPGVTVQAKKGKIARLEKEIMDLPGIYSLFSETLDAKVTRDFVRENPECLYLNVVDITRLRRSLFLTLQLLQITKNIILVLNFSDKKKQQTNLEPISRKLGIPVVRISAFTGQGIDKLIGTIEGFTPPSNSNQEIPKLDLEDISEDERIRFIDKTYETIESILPYDDEKIDLDQSKYEKLDRFMLHPLTGLILFVFVMFFSFKLTFTVGGFVSGLLGEGIAQLQELVLNKMPEGILVSFLADGIIAGIGFVLVFIPQLAILFLLIGIMEQSGYLTRVVFIMEKFLAKVGITGKSIAPMLLGFGCNVPAILSTRTVDDPTERKVVALTIPFMSCSARFPVLIILASVISEKYAELIVTMAYFLGIIVAIVTIWLLRTFVYREQNTATIMELPDLQKPPIWNILKTVYNQLLDFITGVGKGMGIGIILVWMMTVFGPTGYIGRQAFENQEYFEKSFTFMVGTLFEPLFKPMGWDERIVVALIFGFVAKELVVGILGMMYGSSNLINGIQMFYSPISLLSLLVFVLLYVPCLGTVFAMKREFGKKVALASVLYSLLIAYLVSIFIFYAGILL